MCRRLSCWVIPTPPLALSHSRSGPESRGRYVSSYGRPKASSRTASGSAGCASSSARASAENHALGESSLRGETRERIAGRSPRASRTVALGLGLSVGTSLPRATSSRTPKRITRCLAWGTPYLSDRMTKSRGSSSASEPGTTRDLQPYPAPTRSSRIDWKTRLPPWRDDRMPFTFSITNTGGRNRSKMWRYSR